MTSTETMYSVPGQKARSGFQVVSSSVPVKATPSGPVALTETAEPLATVTVSVSSGRTASVPCALVTVTVGDSVPVGVLLPFAEPF